MDRAEDRFKFESSAMTAAKHRVIYDPSQSVVTFLRYARTERERKYAESWLECEREKVRRGR